MVIERFATPANEKMPLSVVKVWWLVRPSPAVIGLQLMLYPRFPCYCFISCRPCILVIACIPCRQTIACLPRGFAISGEPRCLAVARGPDCTGRRDEHEPTRYILCPHHAYASQHKAHGNVAQLVSRHKPEPCAHILKLIGTSQPEAAAHILETLLSQSEA